MIGKILAWDIETAKIVPEGERLDDHHPLGISCAATLTNDGDLKLWYGGDQMTPSVCRVLVDYLRNMHELGYMIIGFNSASFDFFVLGTESGMIKTCKNLALEHVDFGLHFFCEKGFMPSLQNIALGMELKGKSGKGKDAPRMWAEGKRNEVLRYVAQDVRVTMSVFQEIQKHSYVKWVTKRGTIGTWFPDSGKLLTVREAMKLPLPNTAWMDKPWSRDKFVGWLKKEK